MVSDAYQQLDQLAATAPPGSRGLLYLPYLATAATPRWNPQARAAFVGLSFAHGRAEMTRAVMEGVVLEIRDMFEQWTCGWVIGPVPANRRRGDPFDALEPDPGRCLRPARRNVASRRVDGAGGGDCSAGSVRACSPRSKKVSPRWSTWRTGSSRIRSATSATKNSIVPTCRPTRDSAAAVPSTPWPESRPNRDGMSSGMGNHGSVLLSLLSVPGARIPAAWCFSQKEALTSLPGRWREAVG